MALHTSGTSNRHDVSPDTEPMSDKDTLPEDASVQEGILRLESEGPLIDNSDHTPLPPDDAGPYNGSSSGGVVFPGAEETGLPAHDAMPADGQAEPSLFAYADTVTDGRSWSDLPPSPTDEDLQNLRTLMFQREIALLDKLKQYMEDPQQKARDVSSIIAEALILRANNDNRLGRALEPVVGGIFRDVLRKNPADFANIIFPLMGPAIRRSIAESFRTMLEGFSKSMELAFSWKGLRWRLEALRTGKPFSEVVLLNTIIYRVEQVFLIHSATGLVLSHAVHEGVDTQDVDMVSAMLTAVQDFVRDCFTGGGSGGELESMQLGEFVIMVEKNPYASLACIVRGTPPVSFRQNLRASLELLLIKYSDALAKFNGDSTPFAEATDYLNDCLSSSFVGENSPLPAWAKALPVLLLLGCAFFLGWWQYTTHLEKEAALALRQERMEAVRTLRSFPGFQVLGSRASADETVWEIELNRDDLTPSPETILEESGFNLSGYAIIATPYISYDPIMVDARVRQAIQPPNSVSMYVSSDGTVSFAGTASVDWMHQARKMAQSVPGVKLVDMDKVQDPRMKQIDEMIKKIQSTTITFPLGKDYPEGEEAQMLVEVVETLVALEKLAKSMSMAVDLTVYGHADSIGSAKRNYEISQERAKAIAAMLYARGSSIPMTLYGMGSDLAENEGLDSRKGNSSQRKIEFRVHLRLGVSAASAFSD